MAMLVKQVQEEGSMVITDNWGYVKHTAACLLSLLMTQGAASAESKFLSLDNGELDIGEHTNRVTISALDLTGGIIITQLSTNAKSLAVTGELTLKSTHACFSFWKNDG